MRISLQDSPVAGTVIIAFESPSEIEMTIDMQITKIMPGSEAKLEVTNSKVWAVVVSHFPIILSHHVLCLIQKRDKV